MKAVSGMLEQVILLSIAVIISGVALGYLLAISYDVMSCEIEALNVIEISDNSYWGELTVLNNGDYDITKYDVFYYDKGITTPIESMDTLVNPGKKFVVEFNMIYDDTSVVIGVDVQNDASTKSMCIQKVEL